MLQLVVQRGTDKGVRQGAKESSQICAKFKQAELGNFGRRVENYYAYARYSKRTPGNERGNLQETGLNDYII